MTIQIFAGVFSIFGTAAFLSNLDRIHNLKEHFKRRKVKKSIDYIMKNSNFEILSRDEIQALEIIANSEKLKL